MNRFSDKLTSRTAALLICFALAAIVWGVFGQTLRYEFVNFDDNRYVYDNPDVELGLSPSGIEQAFTQRYVAIWLPLTMLSYQLDYELSGMNPAAFHRTNVLLHMASATALFLVLRAMTGSLWRSAFVAALFAIHPLRAESVAWISERKDVLSGFFFMLTLGAYTRYVRAAKGKWQSTSRHYLLIVLFFVLGLLAKPMLITLPFVLLLLDFWPLRRFSTATSDVSYGGQARNRVETAGIKKLILEKAPFLLLSGVFCAVAIWTERDIITLDKDVTLLWRIGNAAVSYIVYIKQTIVPTGLAVFYPHLGTELPLWQISASFLLLAMISLTAILFRNRRPYLVVGWLWYLGMLVPVIGILPAWLYAYADRYTYLPQIGLSILLTWTIADLSVRWRHRRVILGAAALLVMTGLGAGAWIQTSTWRNGETLWTHILKQTEDNQIANYNLAKALERNGKTKLAIEQFQRALLFWPEDTEALINLGCIFAEKNELKKASELFWRTLEIKPDSPEAHTNLGIVLAKQGEIERGIEHLQQALKLKPDYLQAHINLGVFLMRQEKTEAAIKHYHQALEIEPDSADTHYNLGVALAKQKKFDDAISHFQQVWTIDPDSERAQRSLDMATKLIMKQAGLY